MPTLKVYDEHGLVRSADVREGIVIGREVAQGLQLDDPKISRTHARIQLEHGKFMIEDMGSANGVYMKGERIQKHGLHHGDEFFISRFRFHFENEAEAHRPKTDRIQKVAAEPAHGLEGKVGVKAHSVMHVGEQDALQNLIQRRREQRVRAMVIVAVVLMCLNAAWAAKNWLLPADKPSGAGPADTGSTQPVATHQALLPFDELAAQFRKEGRESLAALVEYHRDLYLKIPDAAARETLTNDLRSLKREQDKQLDILKSLFFILHEEMEGHEESATTQKQKLNQRYPGEDDGKYIEDVYRQLKDTYQSGARLQFDTLARDVKRELQQRQFDIALKLLQEFEREYPSFAPMFGVPNRVAEIQTAMTGSVAVLLERIESLVKDGNYQGAIDLFKAEVQLYPPDAPGMPAVLARINEIRVMAKVRDLRNRAAEFFAQYQFDLAASVHDELAGMLTVESEIAEARTAGERCRLYGGFFRTLIENVAAKNIRARKLEIGPDEEVIIVNADERGLYARGIRETEARRRGWAQLSKESIARCMLLVKGWTPEQLAAICEWCLENKLPVYGLKFLTLMVAKGGAEDVVQALAARLLGLPAGQGPFVQYKKEWMAESEKKCIIADAAEQKRREAERRELARLNKEAGILFARAVTFLDADNYEEYFKGLDIIANGKWGKTEWGQKAAARLADKVYIKTNDLRVTGPSENRIDVFWMCDGFLLEDQKRFNNMCRQGGNFLSTLPELKEYAGYWNHYWMNVVSNERKLSTPTEPHDTALGSIISGGNGLPLANREKVFEMLGRDPRSEGLGIVFASEGSGGTGGGGIGIFGGDPGGILIHEFHGHAFTGLDDEYTFNLGQTPLTGNSINVAITPDPAQVPWRHWIEKGERGIGVFPGGHGHTTGHWRPTADNCIMSNAPTFCAVCRESLVLHIYSYVNPIDQSTPNGAPIVYVIGEEEEIFLIPMKPAMHDLKVEFYLEQFSRSDDGSGHGSEAHERVAVPEPEFGESDPVQDISGGAKPRLRGRGMEALAPIHGTKIEAVMQPTPDRSNIRYSIPLKKIKRKWAPGTYMLAARVVDETPWVIQDPQHLLEERQFWEIHVYNKGEEPQPEEPVEDEEEEEADEGQDGAGGSTE